MENTSKTEVKARDVYYYRQRLKNRVFSRISEFFVKEAERTGVTKRDIALRLNKDPSQITRWLTEPSNLTLETISDLLLALGAEAEPPHIVRFSDRSAPNYVHPLIARVQGRLPAATAPKTSSEPKGLNQVPDIDFGKKVSTPPADQAPANYARNLNKQLEMAG